MPKRTITVHADQLEYTGEGLQTTTDVELEVGTTNRIVIRRPRAIAAVPVGLGGFAVDSSFPTPVVLAALIVPTLRAWLDDADGAIYQVYAHASPDGNEAHNKEVSDRRAAVFAAMLTGDVDAVEAVAKHEAWSTAEQQVMLRVLRCDPGVIDGEAGELTKSAVVDFQEDYNDGVFHAHAEQTLVHAPLPTDGKLSGATASALIEAFVIATSPLLPPERMHPTHPAVGCSEFNQPAEDGGVLNRRVALVVHDTLPAFHDRAPCKTGDVSACPVDDAAPRRCLWYRAHVVDPSPERPHLHSDPRWLLLPNGNVLLSALTTLADGDDVSFQVFRSKPIAGPDDIGVACLDEPVAEAMPGIVHRGVAQVVWALPEGFDPFDFDDWFVPYDLDALIDNPAAVWDDKPQVRPPLFTVTGGGATVVSEPPGQDLRRIRLQQEDGSPPVEATAAWGFDNYGRALQVDLSGRRMASDERAVAEPHRVMTFEAFGYRGVPKEPG